MCVGRISGRVRRRGALTSLQCMSLSGMSMRRTTSASPVAWARLISAGSYLAHRTRGSAGAREAGTHPLPNPFNNDCDEGEGGGEGAPKSRRRRRREGGEGRMS